MSDDIRQTGRTQKMIDKVIDAIKEKASRRIIVVGAHRQQLNADLRPRVYEAICASNITIKSQYRNEMVCDDCSVLFHTYREVSLPEFGCGDHESIMFYDHYAFEYSDEICLRRRRGVMK